MKKSDNKEKSSFEKDYNEIIKEFQYPNVPVIPTPQWTNPSDFIVKFSLYQESPNSITSTDTYVCL